MVDLLFKELNKSWTQTKFIEMFQINIPTAVVYRSININITCSDFQSSFPDSEFNPSSRELKFNALMLVVAVSLHQITFPSYLNPN